MGNVTVPKILALDLTGTSQANFIENEEHALVRVDSSTNRILLPKRGSFYRINLSVRQMNGVPLIHGTDYRFGHHEQEYSVLTGLDVEGFIVITNPNISNDVRISYQALGADGKIAYDDLHGLLSAVRESELLHSFKDIIGQPEGYPGDAGHLHKYWQIYGFESLIENLNILGTALGDNRKGLKDAEFEYSNIYLSLVNDIMIDYRSYLTHLVDYSNPHNTTATHLDLQNLNDWRLANYNESAVKTIDDLYMPMSGAISLIETYALPYLTAHLRDKENPHEVTLDQLDLYSELQIRALYAERLHRSEGSYDSKLFSGNTLGRLVTDTQTNLDTSNLNPDVQFNRDRIASPIGNTGDMALIGNNTFKHIREIVSRPDLESSWVMLPGVVGSRALAWNSCVAASVPAYRIMLKNFYAGYMIETLACRRNPDGTTSVVFN